MLPGVFRELAGVVFLPFLQSRSLAVRGAGSWDIMICYKKIDEDPLVLAPVLTNKIPHRRLFGYAEKQKLGL